MFKAFKFWLRWVVFCAVVYLDVYRMANRALSNGIAHQTKITRCASSVGDSGTDKTKVGWTSPRDIWRNLSLRRKAEVINTIYRHVIK